MNSQYLEDLSVGQRIVSGAVTFTESGIIDFAMHYDPQSFHIDTVEAGNSHFTGLIASGIQTLAITFRLFIQTGIFRETGMGSPGLDEIRWHVPVRPGDTLHSEVEVLELTPSRSKPDRGVAKLRFNAINQRGDLVLSFTGMTLLKRRMSVG